MEAAIIIAVIISFVVIFTRIACTGGEKDKEIPFVDCCPKGFIEMAEHAKTEGRRLKGLI